jgi:hypothetical protein
MARCGCSNAASSVGVADTTTLDLSLLASVISGNVNVDALPGNLLGIVAGGLRVDCDDVAACVGSAADVGVLDSDGIDLSTTGAGTPGDPRIISADTKAVFFQTAAVIFTRTLSGTADVYEEVTELPDLQLTTPGTYIVAYEAVGNATITAGTSAVSAACAMALYKNGALVANSETRLILNSEGLPTTTEPALQLHASGTGIAVVTSDGDDLFTIWAARNSAAGTTTTIISNTNGRTRIRAWRIGA